MSHVATVSLIVKDLAALKLACAAIGLEFREGQRTYRWWGRSVGDYKLPDGFKAEDLGKCDHALHVKGNDSAYEIGVCRAKDGSFKLLWDFYAGGKGLQYIVGKDCNRLKQEYAKQIVLCQARKQGMRVRQEIRTDGSIALSLEG